MFAYMKGRPITYAFSSFYGIIFAMFFLLYGGVKVILSFMDHNYETLRDPIIFTLIGVIFIVIALAYRDLKNWGWYGMIVVHGLAIIGSLFSITQPENIAVLALSGLTLFGLLAPATKAALSTRT